MEKLTFKVKSIEEFLKDCYRIHKDRFDYSLTEYKGWQIPFLVKCIEHGIFTTNSNDHLYNKNGGCRKCHLQNNRAFGKYLPSSLTEEQFNILTGCLLGDGSITKNLNKAGNYKFQFQQSEVKQGYVQYIHDKLEPFTNKIITVKRRAPTLINGQINNLKNWNGKYKIGYITRTCSHPIFTDLHNKWYIPNEKIEHRKWIKIIPIDLKLNWQIIAHWLLDDGNNNYRNKSIVFATHSYSKTEVDMLCDKLFNDLRIIANPRKHYEDFRIGLPISMYDYVIDNVEPYINKIECMTYKLRRG